jgi:nucleoid-associated protein YgaU
MIDRPAAALAVVVILVLLGLIMAFAGRPTLRFGWAILSSGLAIATLVGGSALAVGLFLLPHDASNQPAPSAAPSIVVRATPVPKTKPKVTTYVVQSGDTLRTISLRFYHAETGWQRIYNANRNRIPNPDSLVVGTRLVIPPAP